MTYIKVKWIHTHPDEPVELFSELDDKRWEARKIEVFANRTMGYAGRGLVSLNPKCKLGEEPVPNLEQIAADPQFQPTEISKDEFESIWIEATK